MSIPNLANHESVGNNDSETAYLMLKIAMERYQCSHQELQKEQQVEVLNQAFKLKQLNNTILASSQADNVEVPENEIEATLKQIIERYETVTEFEQAISQHGISRMGFKELLADELKVNAVLETISKDIEVTDAEVAEYYQNNQNAFLQPETRKVRHILITINEEFPENSRLDSLLRLSLIANEVSGDLEKFKHFAMTKSECPTALNEGLVGTIPVGQLYPELDEQLFSMEENSLSEVIETELGFHLVWCEGIYPERLIPLTEVEQEVKSHLQQKKQAAFQRQWIAQQVRDKKSANH